MNRFPHSRPASRGVRPANFLFGLSIQDTIPIASSTRSSLPYFWETWWRKLALGSYPGSPTNSE